MLGRIPTGVVAVGPQDQGAGSPQLAQGDSWEVSAVGPGMGEQTSRALHR